VLTTVGNCDNGSRVSIRIIVVVFTHHAVAGPKRIPVWSVERLFGDGAVMPDRMAELKRNASLLDWVGEDIARLQKKLGPVTGRR